MHKQYIHREGPNSAPADAQLEVDAFGVGVGVTLDDDSCCDAVLLRQAVRGEGGSFLVRSELPAAEARSIAERLIFIAEKVERRERTD